MLKIELDSINGIAILKPDGALSKKDFDEAASVIDPYIERYGKLRGLIISAQAFPGWESFGSFIKHLEFIKNHHSKLSHVALVTDSELGDLAENIAGHFIAAKIKHFPYDHFSEAQHWILN
ncbi:MAG: STAS/SEC14 domain-containing protein [Burkholderiales bacterium]|nr:STAS/SEC14 domain-containing protein [Burkholderiales bacterium]MDR4517601.1 STAS/SEC14 domain-containing protein [Nitrosomonas sp.]